jgi:GNAT superfamily N-acetyltransferase
MQILPITPDFDGFDALWDASVAEGQRMLARLQENWVSGLNRFDRPGEILVGAVVDGDLAGVCGRNVDPFASDAAAGRVRHLYVAPVHRGEGIGSQLVRFTAGDAADFFQFLNTRAPPQAFEFYERLGFSLVLKNNTVTHRLYF